MESVKRFLAGWRLSWPYLVIMWLITMGLAPFADVIITPILFFLPYWWCLAIHFFMEKKESLCFFSFYYIFLYILSYIVTLLILILIAFLGGGLSVIFGFEVAIELVTPAILSMLNYFIFLSKVLLFFSLLDAEKSVGGFWYAIVRVVKIMVYKAPLWIVLFGVLYGGVKVLLMMHSGVNNTVEALGVMVLYALIFFLFIPLSIAFISTRYVKGVHDCL